MNRSTFAFGFALLTIATPALADEASVSAAPAATKTEATTPAPVAKETAEPTVLLHVKSPAVVSIEREDNGEVVCLSPCDREVPATLRYRIGGSRPSRPFALDGHNGAARLDVQPATKAGFWGGVAALGASGALIASGAITLALGYASKGEVPGADGTVSDTTYSDTMILGTVLVVAGATAGLFGGASVITNTATTVRGNIQKDPPARGEAQQRRSAALESSWSPGATFFVPILRGAF